MKKRILVVEDNQVSREQIVQRLTKEGFLVEEAEDGLIGLEKVKDHDIDLVVLDINMPVMDGIEALPLMLQSKPNLPVIIHSKYGGYKEDFQSWLAKDFINKDPQGDLTELVATINRHIYPKTFQ